VFHSTEFSIENRPGLEDQSIEKVLQALHRLGAPDILPSTHSTSADTHKRIELAKWLSDWHLIAFLGTTGLIPEADVNLMMRTASLPNLLENTTLLDPLLTTEGWQTLMTFTRESAPPSSTPAHPPGSTDHGIDPDIMAQIRAQEAASGGPPTDMGGSGGIRICPHCTFENSHGGGDCEVCGLPLS